MATRHCWDWMLVAAISAHATVRVVQLLRHATAHDFGAAGTSGALVTGVPASVSGATKLTRSSTSLPLRPASGSNSYEVTEQFGTSARRSMSRICVFRHALEQVAQAIDGHLMADDQYALAPVLARDRVEHAAQPQDHVAPAFAARWAEIELADVRALLGEIRIFLADAEFGQPVERAEFLLAQALVALDRQRSRIAAGRVEQQPRRFDRPHVGRATARPSAASLAGSAPNQRPSAAACCSPSGDSGVSMSRVAMSISGTRRALGLLARHVARTLAMANDPQRVGPLLLGHRRALRSAMPLARRACGGLPACASAGFARG